MTANPTNDDIPIRVQLSKGGIHVWIERSVKSDNGSPRRVTVGTSRGQYSFYMWDSFYDPWVGDLKLRQILSLVVNDYRYPTAPDAVSDVVGSIPYQYARAIAEHSFRLHQILSDSDVLEMERSII